MTNNDKTCPACVEKLLSLYFMEHRAKLLDIAAYLDRLDRATGDRIDDCRIPVFDEAIKMLIDGNGDRTKRILDLLSDQTDILPHAAGGAKGAVGAPKQNGGK